MPRIKQHYDTVIYVDERNYEIFQIHLDMS
jgi:hypothetical protein